MSAVLVKRTAMTSIFPACGSNSTIASLDLGHAFQGFDAGIKVLLPGNTVGCRE